MMTRSSESCRVGLLITIPQRVTLHLEKENNKENRWSKERNGNIMIHLADGSSINCLSPSPEASPGFACQ